MRANSQAKKWRGAPNLPGKGVQARPVHKGSLYNAQGRRNPRGAKLVSLKKFYNVKGALIKFFTGASGRARDGPGGVLWLMAPR